MTPIRYLLTCFALASAAAPAFCQSGFGWDRSRRYPQTQPTQVTSGYIIDGQYHYPNCGCEICKTLRAREVKQEVKKEPPKEEQKPTPPTPPEGTPAPKEDTPPPAPKDPEEKPTAPRTPAVKSSDDTSRKTPTREEVVKSIQDNPHIPDAVKKEILDTLNNEQPKDPIGGTFVKPPVAKPFVGPPTPDQSTPPPAPPALKANEGGFDLLEALKKRNSKPGVKSYTDETPFKPANPPRGESAPDPKTAPKEPAKDLPKRDFILMPAGLAAADSPYEIPTTDIGISVGGKVDYTNSWDQTKPVPYGKTLQFWVKPVTRRPDKLKSVAYTWTVLPREDVVLWPDTTRILFSSGVKHQSYVVMLTASYVFVDGDKISQFANQAIAMVQVGEATTTTPGSDPSGVVPPKNPPPPPTLTGLSRQAYEWVTMIQRSGDYTDEMVKADAAILANVFAKVSKKINGSELVDVNEIITTTKTENEKAIVHAVEWAPWFTKMKELLKTGWTENSIRTPDQYKVVWDKIAAGLDAASK
jgi:hypothetical protein